MFASFRLAMSWLHTWFGLVLGFVLMVVFFFGSMSVFDREIDRWAVPLSRFEPQPMPSFDTMMAPLFQQMVPEEEELEDARQRIGGPVPSVLQKTNWSAYTTHRDPVLSLFAEFAVPNPNDPEDHVHGHVTLDPRTGAILPHSQLNLGSDFFYPMHYSLHLHWMDLGYWIVGLSALVMLAALVSGLVIHRKIFREFFTFRPEKHAQRSTLDLHNFTGVLALPFHFFFAFSGILIFAGMYFPVSTTLLEPLAQAGERIEASTKGLAHKPAGVPAPLASVDAMVSEAKQRWEAKGMKGEVGFLHIRHVGDIKSSVSIFRAGSDRVTLLAEGVHFDGPTGRVIREEPAPSAVSSVSNFLVGLHLQHFEHWLLRWLYVVGGLSGCACIASGILFFVGKRKKKHAAEGIPGARWVDALAVTSITGIGVATMAMLVSNRLFPANMPHLGDWEERVFWVSWLLAFLHASWRSAPVQKGALSPAWREQCWAAAGLAVSAVVLNWITTGDHLLKTLTKPYWPVAGFDLVLLVAAAAAAWTARVLRRRERRAAGVSTEDGTQSLSMGGTPEAAHG